LRRNFAPTNSPDARIFSGDVRATLSFAGRTQKQEKIAWDSAGEAETIPTDVIPNARKARVRNPLFPSRSDFPHGRIEKTADRGRKSAVGGIRKAKK
jgi:hypothetical protein